MNEHCYCVRQAASARECPECRVLVLGHGDTTGPSHAPRGIDGDPDEPLALFLDRNAERIESQE